MRCYRLLVAVLWQLLALALTAPAAQAAPTHIAAQLVAESAVNPGETVWLAFVMKPEKGWHGYWSNPGDAGLGMSLTWTLPPGFTAGDLAYPVPDTLLISGLMNHVYEHEYAVLVPVRVSRTIPPQGHVKAVVEAQWLACTDTICVPEQARLETTLVIGPGQRTSGHDPRFDQWRTRLPAPLGAEAHFARESQTILLGVPLPASMTLEHPHVFAAEDKLVDYAAPQRFFRQGDLLVVELQRPKVMPRDPRQLAGVLRLNAAGDGVSFVAQPGAVPAGGEPIGDAAAAPETASLPLLLLLALAGGLVLNIMPCVFPILSLKALSLARSGESQAHARTEGLAYTAGVVVACAALGALLLALRAAGQEVGWAFQLQEPGVVVALLALAVAITANLLGLFEFAVPGFASSGSPQGAFATGLLAAFVATPCTGPFMAAAMGAALLLPVAPAMLLFVTLGLGLALPFLAIAWVPALRRLLPKPGAWMAWFKRAMAVPMALTALALLWLTSRIGGDRFALGAACLAFCVVMLAIYVGKLQRKGKSAAMLVTVCTLLLTASGWVLLGDVRPPTAEAQGVLPSSPFSDAALAEARAQGKPVFAYFTADWCLTCKVNEEVAIERTKVRDAFAQHGVVVLRGDWTRRDPAITRYLTAQGAAGVPLYVWYPARGEPRKLPQVLTAGGLVDLAAK